jgi:hypothetical protein
MGRQGRAQEINPYKRGAALSSLEAEAEAGKLDVALVQLWIDTKA